MDVDVALFAAKCGTLQDYARQQLQKLMGILGPIDNSQAQLIADWINGENVPLTETQLDAIVQVFPEMRYRRDYLANGGT